MIQERLDQLQHAAIDLGAEKPEFTGTIDPQIVELAHQWEQLEKTTEEKGQKLFDANRQQLYVQSIADMKVSCRFSLPLRDGDMTWLRCRNGPASWKRRWFARINQLT